MTPEAHDLRHEFPEYAETIHALKIGDRHFARLFDEYHSVNRHVHRIEAEVEVVSDETLEDLKKQRLLLKDQLYALLRAQAPA